MREEYKAAADAGRAYWKRETLKAADSMSDVEG
jgi:hypothetical protein